MSRLSAQSSIQQHENLGLRKAIKIEQKKRQCGKRLNLIGEEGSGPQIFTPSQVDLARAYLASKENAEQARKDEIAEKKAASAAKRAQKAIEVASRKQQRADAALQRVAARQVALEERAQKALERLTKKNVLNALKAEGLAARKLAKKAKIAKKQVPKPLSSAVEPIPEPVEEERIVLTIRGRAVRQPKYLNE